jgi:DNA-binding response OmpR family regulator
MRTVSGTLLLVEDDPAFGQMIQRSLQCAHHTVELLHTGREAIARIQRGGIELVIVEQDLPGVSGQKVCRQLRLVEDDFYVPVILLTEAPLGPDSRKAVLTSADDYIYTPFQLEDLEARVAVWLRHRHRSQSSLARHVNEVVRITARTTTQELYKSLAALQAVLREAHQSADTGGQSEHMITHLHQAEQEITAQISAFQRIERRFNGSQNSAHGSWL